MYATSSIVHKGNSNGFIVLCDFRRFLVPFCKAFGVNSGNCCDCVRLFGMFSLLLWRKRGLFTISRGVGEKPVRQWLVKMAGKNTYHIPNKPRFTEKARDDNFKMATVVMLNEIVDVSNDVMIENST